MRFHSSLVTGSVLDAIHWDEVQCNVNLSFTDYRVVSYIFIPSFVLGLIAALKINFGVSRDFSVLQSLPIGKMLTACFKSRVFKLSVTATPSKGFAIFSRFLFNVPASEC
jgi:hypothetical protein